MLNMSVNDFLDSLSSKTPVPGGGSVAALLGALCCSLGNMVCNLTIGKKKYSEYDRINIDIARKMTEIQMQFKLLYDQDIEAFENLVPTYRLPSTTKEEQDYKSAVMHPLLQRAIEVPLSVMHNCNMVLELIYELRDHVSVLAISDIGVAVSCAKACLESSALNVLINSKALKDRDEAEIINKRTTDYLNNGLELAEKIYNDVFNFLSSENS